MFATLIIIYRNCKMINNYGIYIYIFTWQINIYRLLTKCEVKMAGYWPSFFCVCLWTETESRAMN